MELKAVLLITVFVGLPSELGLVSWEQVTFILICVQVTSAVGAAVTSECSRPAEVVFLVDTSRSIYPLDFPLELTFVQGVISQFKVSPSDTRVAVITFSRGVRQEFGLNQYASAAAMQLAVANIAFTAGDTTDTGDAIKNARDVILRDARPGVTRIIIVITDGRSTERSKTVQEANTTRDAGILVLAVGVGNGVDYRELGQIATENTKEFVHTVTDFPGLTSISALVGHAACTATTAPLTTTENPQNDQNLAQQVCGGKPADIVFLVDRSSSVYVLDFQEQLKDLQNIVNVMDIGPAKTQIAAVSFSSNVTVEFYLDDFSTRRNVHDRLAKIQYTGGVTETGQALSVVRDEVLSPSHGARSTVTQVVIVVTDGLSQNARLTNSTAALLKDDGVKVFAIGVGPNVDRGELEAISSQPYSDFLFQIDGYQALKSIQYLLAVKACHTLP